MWQHHRQLLEAGPAAAEGLAARLMAGERGRSGPAPWQGRPPGAGTRTDEHHPLPAGHGAPGRTFPEAARSEAPTIVPGTNLFLGLGADPGSLAPLVDLVLDLRTVLGSADAGGAPAGGEKAPAGGEKAPAGDGKAPAGEEKAPADGAVCCRPRTLALPVPPFKRDKTGLLRRLSAILGAARPTLLSGGRLGLVGDAGGDALAGAAVAVLATLYSLDARGGLQPRAMGADSQRATVSKTDVRRYLGVVSGAVPAARPTRGMLKQVFAHFHGAGRHEATA